MHEAGIAASILEVCEAEAKKNGAVAIRTIKLRLGGLTGVVPEALEFAFEALKADTLAAQGALEIERIALSARCPACGWKGEPEGDICLLCPDCSAPLDILAGREMEIEYIDLEQETECNASR